MSFELNEDCKFVGAAIDDLHETTRTQSFLLKIVHKHRPLTQAHVLGSLPFGPTWL
jgi:hypothetical protein